MFNTVAPIAVDRCLFRHVRTPIICSRRSLHFCRTEFPRRRPDLRENDVETTPRLIKMAIFVYAVDSPASDPRSGSRCKFITVLPRRTPPSSSPESPAIPPNHPSSVVGERHKWAGDSNDNGGEVRGHRRRQSESSCLPLEPTPIEENGLKKKLIKEGEGSETLKDVDEVKVDYTETLLDGTQFNSSRDKDTPLKFKLDQ
ncbi:hypothetical protein GQ457_08G014100 [Hibiscus cannabinus]